MVYKTPNFPWGRKMDAEVNRAIEKMKQQIEEMLRLGYSVDEIMEQEVRVFVVGPEELRQPVVDRFRQLAILIETELKRGERTRIVNSVFRKNIKKSIPWCLLGGVFLIAEPIFFKQNVWIGMGIGVITGCLYTMTLVVATWHQCKHLYEDE